jgi:tetratricopeptide (TPR) repeat protein
MGLPRARLSLCIRVCVCLSAVAIPPSATAFQFGKELYDVSGRVFDEQTQQTVSRVELTLREPGGVMRAQMVTNDGGRFEFGAIGRGSYQITASAAGYQPLSSDVSVGAGAERGLAIYLKRIAANPVAASGASVSAHELSMPQKARDLVNSGKQKIFYGKNAEAGIADFKSAVALAPDYYEAYYQIGMTYLETGKREDAEKNFDKSIELSHEKYGEPVIGLGMLLLDKGDNGGGEKTIRRGLELSPNFWLGYYELGRACLAQNRLDDAKKAGERARSLMPTAATVYRLMANVHMREKDYPALLEDIDAYLKIDPDGAAASHAKEMRAEVMQKIKEEKIVSDNATPR